MKDHVQLYFFLGLFLASFVLVVILFAPFGHIIALSAIISVLVRRPYEWLAKKLGDRRNTAAFLTVILSIIVLSVPLSFLTVQIVGEARSIYEVVSKSDFDLASIAKSIETPLRTFAPNITIDFKQYFSQGLNLVISNAGGLISRAAALFADMFLIMIALFFFLRDGVKFKKTLIAMSPLANEHDEEIATRLEQMIISVVRGTLSVAVLQGILVGLGFFVFGVPNATLWGTVAALAAFIPGIGTGLVVFPAVVFLYFTAPLATTIGLALWGILLVGLVDNFLAPYFRSKGAPVDQIFVLFAVLGGLSIFGPLGFLFGPLIVSFYFALLDIYARIIVPRKLT